VRKKQHHLLMVGYDIKIMTFVDEIFLVSKIKLLLFSLSASSLLCSFFSTRTWESFMYACNSIWKMMIKKMKGINFFTKALERKRWRTKRCLKEAHFKCRRRYKEIYMKKNESERRNGDKNFLYMYKFWWN